MASKKTLKHFCIAPWVHTFCGPEGNRRLCCPSEDSPNTYQDFNTHWNSEYMRTIRTKLLADEIVEECHRCDPDNSASYRTYLNGVFEQQAKELMCSKRDRSIAKAPISIDYRVSHLCNFKCMMCGPHYSTSWESEVIQRGGAAALPKWLGEDRARTRSFQNEVSPKELMSFIESGQLIDLYWAGGEPLLNPVHWQAMKLLISTNQAGRVLVRYNTNLSFTQFRNERLVDLLAHFDRFHLGASLDAGGEIGEYLRFGLNWKEFQKNFDEILKIADGGKRYLYIEHRLTLPGLLALPDLAKWVKERDVVLQSMPLDVDGSKAVPIHPLCLPKILLNPLLKKIIAEVQDRAPNHCRSALNLMELYLDTNTAHEDLSVERFESEFKARMFHYEITDKHRYGHFRFLELFKSEPKIYEFLSIHATRC